MRCRHRARRPIVRRRAAMRMPSIDPILRRRWPSGHRGSEEHEVDVLAAGPQFPQGRRASGSRTGCRSPRCPWIDISRGFGAPSDTTGPDGLPTGPITSEAPQRAYLAEYRRLLAGATGAADRNWAGSVSYRTWLSTVPKPGLSTTRSRGAAAHSTLSVRRAPAGCWDRRASCAGRLARWSTASRRRRS